MRRTRPTREKGFTLVEALLAAVILAMVTASILAPFTAGARGDQHNARQTLALALAEDLMEEILSKPLLDPEDPTSLIPGADPGDVSTRDYFDNVDDYHSYAEPTGEIRPYLSASSVDPLAESMSRSVEVQYVRLAGQEWSVIPAACRVTVRVFHHNNEMAKLTRLVYAKRRADY